MIAPRRFLAESAHRQYRKRAAYIKKGRMQKAPDLFEDTVKDATG